MIKNFAVIVMVVSSFFLGYATRKPKTVTEKVLVSERMEACEAKGGHYRFSYGTFTGKYSEYCEAKTLEITDY